MREGGIFVVGSLNADLVVGVERRPRPGETVLGDDLRVGPGGKGANQAVAAARFGGRTQMLGRVGADEHGRMLVDSLAAAGVDTRHVRTADGRPTGAALITVTRDGENEIVVSPGANATVTGDDVRAAEADLRAAAVLLCQLELGVEVVAAASRVAAASGVRVVLNAAPPRWLPDDVLAACDPLVVNVHEANHLLGSDLPAEQMPRAARGLLALGPRSVIVTLGAGGALWADGSGGAHVPARSVAVVDTTGAGDAFVGSLAVRLAGGAGLDEATAYAVRAGTAAVQVDGAQAFPLEPDGLEPEPQAGVS